MLITQKMRSDSFTDLSRANITHSLDHKGPMKSKYRSFLGVSINDSLKVISVLQNSDEILAFKACGLSLLPKLNIFLTSYPIFCPIKCSLERQAPAPYIDAEAEIRQIKGGVSGYQTQE